MNIFLAIEMNSETDIKRDTGLTKAQFEDLFNSLSTLHESITSQRIASDSLYIYLLKMRSGQPDEDIGRIFKINRMTVGRRLKTVRNALEVDFVDNHINFIRSREELIGQSTTMCNGLFSSENAVVLICDGTYIFINKSRNYGFQRNTYSDQKKRNFIKIMMCVTPNGTIVFALGPYAAKVNDAKILQSIDETSNAFDMLQPNDILILDRGFRDCISYFQKKGLQIKMPMLLQRSKNKSQFTTKEANQTRLVTATRFVVEARNGNMKTVWKIFKMEWNSLTIPNLLTDFKICASILNHYYVEIEPNAGIATEIFGRMLARMDLDNFLSKIVRSSSFQKNMKHFQNFDSFEELPTLTGLDLIWIALGRYQIVQAESYCRQHMKASEGFAVFSLSEDLCRKYFESFYSENCSPKLLLVQMNSRFRAKKKYDTFVLINVYGSGESAVLGYCCECYNGLRTVGCCSHVMSLIWFSLHIKNQNVPNPAGFLDEYFERSFENEEIDE